MATVYWLGGDSNGGGDLNIATNWSSGSVPTAGDTIIFDSRAGEVDSTYSQNDSAYQTTGEHYSVTSGFTDVNVNFAKIIIAENFTGNIGHGTGTSYTISSETIETSDYTAFHCGADEIIIQGSGEYHFICDNDNFDSVVISNSTARVYLGCDNAKEITSVINISSQLEILSANDGITAAYDITAPDIESLIQVGGTADATIPNGNTGTLEFELLGGTLTLEDGFTSGIVHNGGSLVWGSDTLYPTGTETGVYLENNGGSVRWQMESTLTEYVQYDGTLTAYGASTKTMGDGTENTVIYGGTMDLCSQQSGTVTITAGSDVQVKLRDAKFIAPQNADIDWS